MWKELWQEFKRFAMRGSVIDLAVGIVIGGAFGRIVTSLVNDLIMPPIGLVLGKVDFSNLYINLSGRHYPSLAAAEAAGAATINYGVFINNVIDFLIVSCVIFMVIRQVNRISRPHEDQLEPATKECPYCCSTIPLKAVRCPNCTSDLQTA